MADNYDLIAVKGDTIRWNYFFTGTAGTTYNFVGSTLYMQVRNGYNPATLVASYSLYVQSNSVLGLPVGYTGGLSSATGGTVNMCIGSSFSNDLTPDRICKYDLRIITGQEKDTTTLLRGNIQVLSEVTNI